MVVVLVASSAIRVSVFKLTEYGFVDALSWTLFLSSDRPLSLITAGRSIYVVHRNLMCSVEANWLFFSF